MQTTNRECMKQIPGRLYSEVFGRKMESLSMHPLTKQS